MPNASSTNSNVSLGPNSGNVTEIDLGTSLYVGGSSVGETIDRSASALDLIIDAGAGDDLVLGGRAKNRLFGGKGNDTILGNAARLSVDSIAGGDDDDFILADWNGANPANAASSWTALGDAGRIAFAETAGAVNGRNTVSGDDGSDVIVGGMGSDFLDGGKSADTIWGGGGRDVLLGGGGSDLLYAGSGNDSVDGGSDDDTIYSGSGNDTINGGTGDDVIRNGFFLTDAGWSSSQGQSGQYFGDVGNDLIQVGGLFRGLVNGGTGADTLDGRQATGAFTMDGETGDDILLGGSGNETANGGAGSDVLDLGAGNDVAIWIEYRNDVLDRDVYDGGAGVDTLRLDLSTNFYLDNSDQVDDLVDAFQNNGGKPVPVTLGNRLVARNFENLELYINGKLAGGGGSGGGSGGSTNQRGIAQYPTNGNDTVFGALVGRDQDAARFTDMLDGNDLFVASNASWRFPLVGRAISGGRGNDTLIGRNAADTFYGGEGNDKLLGGEGNDLLVGGPGRDLLDGGLGEDTLTGGDDSSTLLGGAQADSISGGLGNDSIDGGAGDDYISGDRAGAGADTIDAGSGNDTIAYVMATGNTYVIAGEGDDTFIGGTGNNTVFGGTGRDLLEGNLQGGNDFFAGQEGNDTLRGWGGNDTLAGGSGSDLLWGGSGDDTFIFSADTVGGGETISFSGNGRSTYSVVLDASVGLSLDTFIGENGYDQLVGTDGNDAFLLRREGEVTIKDIAFFDARGGNDLVDLRGYARNASIDGGSGNDVLLGGDQKDTIVGGAGNDTLLGGKDMDLFVYRPESSGNDLIVDFTRGEDRIDLRALGVTYDQLKASAQVTNTGIMYSLGSDRGTITVAGVASLSASDFLLAGSQS